MKSFYASWKHYIRTSLNTRRAVAKTSKLVKPLERLLVSNQTLKITARSIKPKSPDKSKMPQFLKSHFNFNKFIIMSKIKKRLKRRKYLGIKSAPFLKHIKRKRNKFVFKTFKRRLSLKKAPKFIRAIFLLKKRKALLRASFIKSSRLNQANWKFSGSGSVYSHQKSIKVRLHKQPQAFNVLRRRHSTSFCMRIPKWQICYRLKKSGQQAYAKF